MAPLQAIDFTIAAVITAVNPSMFGYHHGPIPNNNHCWVPIRHQIAVANGFTSLPLLSTGDVSNPPYTGVRLSRVNTGMCDIVVDGGQMCGVIISDQTRLRRHLRTYHPGATFPPSRTSISAVERVTGENAIRLFVLSMSWRNARYLHEPGRGPEGIASICDAAERIAAEDPAFAARFGTQFHRYDSDSGTRGLP